jgi:hypothetical protein
MHGQSKDGRKPIARIGKQVRSATSERTKHPNRHYPVDSNVWSCIELEWKDTRGKRLATGYKQNGQRNYRNATVHPLGNPTGREWLNPGDGTFGSWTITLCPRLLRQPAETKGAREVLLETKGSALSQWLNHMSHLDGDQVEENFLEIGKTFRGEIMPDTIEDRAYQVAMEWTERQDTAWTDGCRQENGRVGCAVAWQEADGNWTGHTTHMGTNGEVFDAELEAIGQAMRTFTQRNQTNRHYTIFSDSQAALRR